MGCSGTLKLWQGLIDEDPLAQKISPTAHRLLTTLGFLLKETPAYTRGLCQFSSLVSSQFSACGLEPCHIRIIGAALQKQISGPTHEETGPACLRGAQESGGLASAAGGPFCSQVEGALFLSLSLQELLITKPCWVSTRPLLAPPLLVLMAVLPTSGCLCVLWPL